MPAHGPWRLTKRQVEQYQFSSPDGFGWAIITLDPRGIFQAVSDFGVYAYDGWGHHGCDSFKHFLVQLREADYFITKVCGNGPGRTGPGRCGQIFDFDKTAVEFKRRILERRRDDSLSKATARACWDEFSNVEETRDETYFITAIADHCPDLFEHVFDNDHCTVADSCCTVLAPGPLAFFNEVFRGQLVPALQAELDAEAPRAEAASA